MSRERAFLTVLVVFFAWQNIAVGGSTPESEGWIKGNGDVYWKNDCDWRGPSGDDITSVKSPADRCGDVCSNWKGCSHFTWTDWEGGTCFLKRGGNMIAKFHELVAQQGAVCGWRYCYETSDCREGGRSLSVNNNCPSPVWVASTSNHGSSPLPDGLVKLDGGQSHTFNIPPEGWAGRLWPKTGCDGSGYNCAIGDSVPPCPEGGCQPPAETKVEFLWPAAGAGSSWYDISLVDGYSLPVRIDPLGGVGGSCVTTTCAVSLETCPAGEIDGIGDLRVIRNGQTVACLSPCKRWNFPAPYGLGRDEHQDPGVMFCCPTPPISSQQCSSGPVINTQYVQLVRKNCPSAYSYAYDDFAGLHTCSGDTSFVVTLCPGAPSVAVS